MEIQKFDATEFVIQRIRKSLNINRELFQSRSIFASTLRQTCLLNQFPLFLLAINLENSKPTNTTKYRPLSFNIRYTFKPPNHLKAAATRKNGVRRELCIQTILYHLRIITTRQNWLYRTTHGAEGTLGKCRQVPNAVY